MDSSDLDTFIATMAEEPYDPYPPSFTGTADYVAGLPTAYRPPFVETVWESFDGTPLAAVFAFQESAAESAESRPAVLLLPVWLQRKTAPAIIEMARCLHANGYHVASLDQRGSGASRHLSDRPFTMGWKEAEDALALAAALRRRPDVSTVGIVGFSLGAGVMTTALALDTEQRFACGLGFGLWAAQELGHRRSIARQSWLRYVKRLPEDAMAAAAAFYGVTVDDLYRYARSYRFLSKVRAPWLAVATLDDYEAAPSHSITLAAYTRSQPNTRLWLLEAGGHAYLHDRWWQELVVLRYLKTFLGPADDRLGTTPLRARKEYPGLYQPPPARAASVIPPLDLDVADADRLLALLEGKPLDHLLIPDRR